MKRVFGLIGYPLGHSFSKKYFTEKFQREGIADSRYQLFEIPAMADVKAVLSSQPDLKGFNITIPYKEQILPYLQAIDDDARAIGAVNVVKISGGELKGFNTDFIGFRDALRDFVGTNTPSKALILGTGGASKAVAYTLKQLGIDYQYVSRSPKNGSISYEDLKTSDQWINTHHLIVNTTPLGTFPKTEAAPEIPYHLLGKEHYLYDLVYNPANTQFMQLGAAKGTATTNGYDMLVRQAEAAWEIWNNPEV